MFFISMKSLFLPCQILIKKACFSPCPVFNKVVFSVGLCRLRFWWVPSSAVGRQQRHTRLGTVGAVDSIVFSILFHWSFDIGNPVNWLGTPASTLSEDVLDKDHLLTTSSNGTNALALEAPLLCLFSQFYWKWLLILTIMLLYSNVALSLVCVLGKGWTKYVYWWREEQNVSYFWSMWHRGIQEKLR